MYKKFSTDDQLFYWFVSGDHTSTIKWEISLSRRVDEDALKKAVAMAMNIHRCFKQRPVIVEGRVKAIEEDIREVPVFRKDEKIRQLGTNDTLGYLFFFSYEDKELMLSLFHGLADGKASLNFLKTVLNCYLNENESLHLNVGEIDSLADISFMEEILKEYEDTKPLGRFDARQRNEEIFALPFEQFELNKRTWRIFEIDVPLKPLLAISKSNESSIVPLLEAIIGKTLREKYAVGEKTILAYTPVDMRSIFGKDSNTNASSNVSLAYRKELDRYELGKRSMFLRSIMDLQIQPENIVEGLRSKMGAYRMADSQPYPIEMIVPQITKMMAADENKETHTYGLSYLGKITLTEKMKAMIDTIKLSVSAYSFPFMIEACEYKGMINMTISQLFDSDEVARAIFEKIRELIPETEFSDRGLRIYERLDLQKLEHQD